MTESLPHYLSGRRRPLVLAAAIALFTAGCTATPEPKPQEGPTEIERSLMESASTIAESRRALAETKNADLTLSLSAEDHALLDRHARQVPPGMDREISLQWDGPVDGALEIVAGLVGYDFKQVGNPHGSAPMVRLRANNRIAVDLVREMGTSVAEQAEVRVHPRTDHESGLIELQYPGVDEG
ncbi:MULTISPECIES: DotD/TraH family lipoprotein [unclassified Thioalkalivibrio]|uniref:DotD/TraH family lipoprotein n=1 Tax=unclassified Thioalkalivibrio TaxID=2621013 RepID=UPI000382773D|nr:MULTISPECIES: DotD/TraH family lipoprotein [unclassified Thioalkalivibrio]